MTYNQDQKEFFARKVQKLQIGQYERHILFCAGPKCCQQEYGERLWLYLKDRLTELGLSPGKVYRSRVHCLRICQYGPIAVVYPEGSWYAELNEAKIDQIIENHLMKGNVVHALQFAQNPL